MRDASTFLQCLRLESRPVAILAGFALTARILLLSLGILTVSDSAVAGLGHLCAPSGYSTKAPVSDDETAAHLCHCGILCAQNAVSKLTATPPSVPSLGANDMPVTGILRPASLVATAHANSEGPNIRAPPYSIEL